MEEMRVYLEGRNWVVAKYIDGRPDARVAELMGTHVLPTPYLSGKNGLDVVARLQSRNPGTLVHLI